jgi:hypothetical protein
MSIIRPITSIGAGAIIYKAIDKYGDPKYPMPWSGVPYFNRVELSNTVSYLTGGLAAFAAKSMRGLSGEARTWLAEYAVTSAVMATLGLFFSPAVRIAPQYTLPPYYAPAPQTPIRYS